MTTKRNGNGLKRSVTIAGHATSVSLEPEFWEALKEIAAAEGLSLNALIARIDARRHGPLSSAIRVHVLERLQQHCRHSSEGWNP